MPRINLGDGAICVRADRSREITDTTDYLGKKRNYWEPRTWFLPELFTTASGVFSILIIRDD